MRFNWNKLKMAVSSGDTCSTLQTEFSLLDEEFFGTRLEEMRLLQMLIIVRTQKRMVR